MNCTRDGKRGSIKWSYDREYRIKLCEKNPTVTSPTQWLYLLSHF